MAALGGAVGGAVSGSGQLAIEGQPVASAIASRFVSSALSQGIGVAVGLQDHFSWTQVAASAVGAGVSAAVGGAIGTSFGTDTFGKVSNALVSGFAGGLTTAVLKGGRISVAQVASDAFGNALGGSLAAANGQQSAAAPAFGENFDWGSIPSDQGYSYDGITGAGDALAAANIGIAAPASAGERANIMGMFDSGGLESVSAVGGTQGFNYASSSNDFTRVNAMMAAAPDFGNGGFQDVDRSNDVKFVDNWSSDPSQNRVLSDAGPRGGADMAASDYATSDRISLRRANDAINGDGTPLSNASPMSQQQIVVDQDTMAINAGMGDANPYANPLEAGKILVTPIPQLAAAKDGVTAPAAQLGEDWNGVALDPNQPWWMRSLGAKISGDAAQGVGALNAFFPTSPLDIGLTVAGTASLAKELYAEGRVAAVAVDTAGAEAAQTVSVTPEQAIHQQAASKGYRDVYVTENGGPTFINSEYLYPVAEGQKNVVEITLQGSRKLDFVEANKAAGLEAEIPAGAYAPRGYVWHHVDNFDPLTGQASLELIQQGAHNATIPHLGSVRQWESIYGMSYKN